MCGGCADQVDAPPPVKGLARRLGGTYGVEGFAAANLLAAVAGEGVGGGANCIWTVANIWALKSSICFKRKPCRLEASAGEIPVEGAKDPRPMDAWFH